MFVHGAASQQQGSCGGTGRWLVPKMKRNTSLFYNNHNSSANQYPPLFSPIVTMPWGRLLATQSNTASCRDLVKEEMRKIVCSLTYTPYNIPLLLHWQATSWAASGSP